MKSDNIGRQVLVIKVALVLSTITIVSALGVLAYGAGWLIFHALR